MKKKTKQLKSLFYISLATFLLYSCNADEDFSRHDSYQKSLKVSHKRFEDIMKQPEFTDAMLKIPSKIKNTSKININTPIQGITVMENEYGFTIIKEVANVIEKDSLITYTMLITRDNTPSNVFENLVVQMDSQNNISAYVIKYINEFELTGDFKIVDFKGTRTVENIIYNTTITGKSMGEIGMLIDDNCIEVETWFCYGPMGHSSSDGCTMGYGIPSTSCNGGGSGGSGSGGTGTGSDSENNTENDDGTNTVYTAPVTDIDTPPCQLLAQLTKLSNQKIKPDIDWLKSKANDITNDTEHGVTFKKTLNYAGGFDFQPNVRTSSPPGQLEVELTVGRSTYGGAHMHPKKGYSIFSYGDLRWLVTAYENAYNNVKEDVVFMLVCKDKVTGLMKAYAIKVDDIVPLKAYVDAVWADPTNAAPTDKEKMQKISKKNAKEMNEPVNKANLEKYFLEKYSNIGFSMYRATSDALTSWDKLVIENNSTGAATVMPKPCN